MTKFFIDHPIAAWVVSIVILAFGLAAWKVERDEDLESSLKAALECGGPALVEVIVSRDAAGPFATGWWDFPSPAYYEKEQAAYAEMRAREQHL